MRSIGRFFILLALLVSSIAFGMEVKKLKGKIVGGSEADRGEFPYIVSFQMNEVGHFCGGSLIRGNWVLTAAHCVEGETQMQVALGVHDQKNVSKSELIKSKRIIMHPKYDPDNQDYDFALVELERSSDQSTVPVVAAPMTLSELQKAKNETGSANDTVIATTAGWGATREGGSLPSLLQKVDVPLVSRELCNKNYNGKITERMICAGYDEGGKDSCQGDSGGPLIMKDKDGRHLLIGVVSWGDGCARKEKFGVYSNIGTVTEWINQTAH